MSQQYHERKTKQNKELKQENLNKIGLQKCETCTKRKKKESSQITKQNLTCKYFLMDPSMELLTLISTAI